MPPSISCTIPIRAGNPRSIKVSNRSAIWPTAISTRNGADRCNDQLLATIVISIISFVFWFVLRRGFNRKVIVLAVPIVALYMTLTATIIGGGVWHLVENPTSWDAYLQQLQNGEWAVNGSGEAAVDWWAVAGMSLLFLPNLALGLSGFEMSMILMPQVRRQKSSHAQSPIRVRS